MPEPRSWHGNPKRAYPSGRSSFLIRQTNSANRNLAEADGPASIK
jgi:hypothetical protein